MMHQFSFWGNVEYPSNEAAKAARNELAKELRAEGVRIRLSVLRDQMRKYAGLGQPDGRIGNVYYVNVIA